MMIIISPAQTDDGGASVHCLNPRADVSLGDHWRIIGFRTGQVQSSSNGAGKEGRKEEKGVELQAG